MTQDGVMGSALFMDTFHPYFKGSTMKTSTSLKSLMIAVAALTMGGATLAAQADTPAAPAHDMRHDGKGHDGKDMAARMAERMARHEARMHESLMLTPAQEPAWQKFIGATRPAKPAMQQRPDRKAFEAMSAPDRMSQFIGMEKKHIAMQESRLDALKTFYAVLTPQQRTVFDHMKQPHHGRGHRGWGHEQHHGWHGEGKGQDKGPGQDHGQN